MTRIASAGFPAAGQPESFLYFPGVNDLLFRLIRKLKQKSLQIILSVIIRGWFVCVYIFIGSCLKEYWMNGIRFLQEKPLSAVLTALLCLLILIPFRFISTDFHLLRFGISVINVLLGIIGTIMIFSLAVLFEKTPVSKPPACLGRNFLILMFIEPLNLLPLTHSFLAAYLNFGAIPVRIISSAVYAAELFLITVFPGKPILSLINRIDRKLSLLKPHADKQ